MRELEINSENLFRYLSSDETSQPSSQFFSFPFLFVSDVLRALGTRTIYKRDTLLYSKHIHIYKLFFYFRCLDVLSWVTAVVNSSSEPQGNERGHHPPVIAILQLFFFLGEGMCQTFSLFPFSIWFLFFPRERTISIEPAMWGFEIPAPWPIDHHWGDETGRSDEDRWPRFVHPLGGHLFFCKKGTSTVAISSKKAATWSRRTTWY